MDSTKIMPNLRARNILVAIFVLSGCNFGPESGTAVGNPTGMTMSVGEGKSIDFDEGTIEVASIEQLMCDGDVLTTTVNRSINLFAQEEITLPTNDFCSLTLHPASPLSLKGTGKGNNVTMSLELDLLSLESPGVASGLRLELGEKFWVDADDIGLGDGDVEIAPGSDFYGTVLEKLVSTSSLRDADDKSEEHSDSSSDTGDSGDQSSVRRVPPKKIELDTGLSADTGSDSEQTPDSGQDSDADSDADSAVDSAVDSADDTGAEQNARIPSDSGEASAEDVQGYTDEMSFEAGEDVDDYEDVCLEDGGEDDEDDEDDDDMHGNGNNVDYSQEDDSGDSGDSGGDAQ